MEINVIFNNCCLIIIFIILCVCIIFFIAEKNVGEWEGGGRATNLL